MLALLEIRMLSSSDVGALVDFRLQHGDDPLLGPIGERSAHSRLEVVRHDLESLTSFGAFDEARLTGLVTSKFLPCSFGLDWTIAGLLVDPVHQGRKIAQRLIRACCDHMSSLTQTCFLVTYHPEGDDSTAARSLYTKLGFVDYGPGSFSHSEQGVRYMKQSMSAESTLIVQRLEAASAETRFT